MFNMPQQMTNPKDGRGFPLTDTAEARRIVKSGKVQLQASGFDYSPRLEERKAIRSLAERLTK